MPPRTRKQVLYVLQPHGDTPVLQAASLAVAILKYTGCGTWAAFDAALVNGDPAVESVLATLGVTKEQEELLAAHPDVVELLTAAPVTLSVVQCDECSAWLVMGPGAKPGSCLVTPGCVSKSVTKSSPASRKPRPSAPETPPETAPPSVPTEPTEAPAVANVAPQEAPTGPETAIWGGYDDPVVPYLPDPETGSDWMF